MSHIAAPDIRRSGTALSRALAKLGSGTSTSSPSRGVGVGGGAASLPTRSERASATLRVRADEARTQQLRGVFAAFDENRDGLLTEQELAPALLALGVDPTPTTIARFVSASTFPSRGIDFGAYCLVNLQADGGPALPRTRDAIINLFAEFDEAKTGRVPLATLLHVLSEVSINTSLSLDEVRELLSLTGVYNATTAADPRALYSLEIAYVPFIRHIEFSPPPPSGSSSLKH